MKPYYNHNGIQIFHDDCLDILPHLEPVDLVITSPPYNLGNNHHTSRYKHQVYDDDLPEDFYQFNQKCILNLIHSKLSHKGWLFYNHKNRIKNGIMITPYEWILKTRFHLRQEIVWNNGTPNMDKCRFFPFTERIYCLSKSHESKIENTLNLTDDWHISPEGTNKKHTRTFPIKIPKRLIESVPNAETILDPFMGSGTTLVAAKELGRKAIEV